MPNKYVPLNDFPKSPYEIQVTQKIHYVIFWGLTGTILLLMQQIIFYTFDENSLFWTRVILVYMVYSLVPIFTILFSHKFKSMIYAINSQFEIDTNRLDYNNWANLEFNTIFSYKTLSAKLISLAICIGGDIVILATPNFHFQSLALNIIFLAMMQTGFVMAGHAGHMILHSLFFLAKLKASNIRTPFLTPPRIALSSISNFYTFASIMVLGMYSLHAFDLWLVSNSFSTAITIWLIMGSFFPLIMVIWSFSYTHLLMQKIKTHYIDTVNKQIQNSLKLIKKNFDNKHIEALNNLITIQTKVELTKTSPVDLGGTLTLMATILAPLIQIGLAVYQKAP